MIGTADPLDKVLQSQLPTYLNGFDCAYVCLSEKIDRRRLAELIPKHINYEILYERATNRRGTKRLFLLKIDAGRRLPQVPGKFSVQPFWRYRYEPLGDREPKRQEVLRRYVKEGRLREECAPSQWPTELDAVPDAFGMVPQHAMVEGSDEDGRGMLTVDTDGTLMIWRNEVLPAGDWQFGMNLRSEARVPVEMGVYMYDSKMAVKKIEYLARTETMPGQELRLTFPLYIDDGSRNGFIRPFVVFHRGRVARRELKADKLIREGGVDDAR